MAAAEATPLSPGEPWGALGALGAQVGQRRCLLGSSVAFLATVQVCWPPRPCPPRFVLVLPGRTAQPGHLKRILGHKGPVRRGRLKQNSAGWYCGSTEPKVSVREASPSSLHGSKKAQTCSRSLPRQALAAQLPCPGLLGNPPLCLCPSSCQEEGACKSHQSNVASGIWHPSLLLWPSLSPCPESGDLVLSNPWPSAIHRAPLLRPDRGPAGPLPSVPDTWGMYSQLALDTGFWTGIPLFSWRSGLHTALLRPHGSGSNVPSAGPCPPRGISGGHSSVGRPS